MSKGRIVEQGNHDSLIANDSVYAKLVRIQSLTVRANADRDSTATTDKESDIEVDTNADSELRKPLARYPSSVQELMERKTDRDNYDLHKQLGILAVIIRLVKETPDAAWSYVFATLSVLGGGQFLSFARSLVTSACVLTRF